MKFTPRTTRATVLLAGAIFLLQATPLLYTRWVEDESWYGSVGYTLLTEGRLRNPTFADYDAETEVDTRPAGLPFVLAGAAKAFGVGPSQLRIPSILAGLGLVLAVFLLGAELINPMGGAIAALLAATDNFLFMTARTVRQDVFVACFGALAVWLYFRARRTGSFLLAVLSALSVGAAINFHPNGIAVAASIGLLLLFEFQFGLLKAPRFWAFVLGLVLAMLPFTLWIVSSPVRQHAFHRLWGRSSTMTPALLTLYEKARYGDFIGIQSQRIPLPVNIPTRIHIAGALVAATVILLRSRRSLLGWMILLMIPSLLLWTTEVNPTSRFFVILAPYLIVLLVAGALEFGKTPGRMRIAMAALVVIALTQVGGNCYLLWRSRTADYRMLTADLRRIIPKGAPAYGAITFWLALYDGPFFSYHRTPLDNALKRGAEYLILNDRVMLHGTGYGDKGFEPLRISLNDFAKTHGRLAGQVHNDFYGDLDIYRVEGPYTALPSGVGGTPKHE